MHHNPEGFLAVPPAGRGAGVLVLHAWWGLNDTIKAFCARLAEAGFVAYAPDLYDGKVTSSIPEAEALSGELFRNLERPRAGIAAAIAFLSKRVGPTEPDLAVIGFSLGAFFALDAAVAVPEHIGAVVVFYGTRPGEASEYGRSHAAFLGHFAEMDEFEPASEVDRLEETLRLAGRPVTFHRYPGAGHWFCEPDRADAYDEGAATLAWARTLAFLKSSQVR